MVALGVDFRDGSGVQHDRCDSACFRFVSWRWEKWHIWVTGPKTQEEPENVNWSERSGSIALKGTGESGGPVVCKVGESNERRDLLHTHTEPQIKVESAPRTASDDSASGHRIVSELAKADFVSLFRASLWSCCCGCGRRRRRRRRLAGKYLTIPYFPVSHVPPFAGEEFLPIPFLLVTRIITKFIWHKYFHLFLAVLNPLS